MAPLSRQPPRTSLTGGIASVPLSSLFLAEVDLAGRQHG